MADLIQPKLVNEPFSDPVLFLDFHFRRRALLFDLRYLTPLSGREIVRVSHVFVSHMHMDHFVGFDRLLRSQLYQPTSLSLIGPPGLGDAVEAKLRAYTWNLLGTHSADLVISAADWAPTGFVRPDTKITAGRRDISLAELLATQALTIGPGQRVAYATDLLYSPENVARVVALAQGARLLFIEAGYLDEDRALAASKCHLTAAQAGRIARAAGVARAVPMHFSSRYLEREDELRREFETNFDGGRKAGCPKMTRNGSNS